MRVLILSLIAFAIVPMTGSAQIRGGGIPVSSAQSGSEIRLHDAASGPTIEAAAVGIRLAPTNIVAASGKPKAQRRSGVNHNVALMIVGVGAMVAGSVIDGTAGTIFLVGGAVVGLYGLFNFLQ
jgi:hypothetical protein